MYTLAAVDECWIKKCLINDLEMNSMGKWASVDVSKIFSLDSLTNLLRNVEGKPSAEAVTQSLYPEFGGHQLQEEALVHLCGELELQAHNTVSRMKNMPSIILADKMHHVWTEILTSFHELYSQNNLQNVLTLLKKETSVSSALLVPTKTGVPRPSEDKPSGTAVLIEVGIKTGLTVIFTLLRQAWSQIAWQQGLSDVLSHMPELNLPPQLLTPPNVNLPNEVLQSVLDILIEMPPLSLSNSKTLSSLSMTCVRDCMQFLEWVISPTSNVDSEGKRLSLQILLSVSLQYGSLVKLLEWVDKVLTVMREHHSAAPNTPPPRMSVGYCQTVLKEIRTRTQLGASEDLNISSFFSDRDDNQVLVVDFVQLMLKEVADISKYCTAYFNGSNSETSNQFLSETCDVYGFGSNSSSQLAMGSPEKFHTPTLAPHMADVQVVEAGQYCTFLVYSDGSVKACGKGSYGRLGLGNSDMQSTLKRVNTFPAETVVRSIISSKGSDGHSMAITADGKVYSWGDGNYWRLGHGDCVTQKMPKLITKLADKVVCNVSCGNRHSAAVTVNGELYTWGEGDHGRLGQGVSGSQRVPTRVTGIGPVQQVACGVAHTLALSKDGLMVWSFGSGDAGKLGHGDTTRQVVPKVIEALRGIKCRKVCAASQFSVVLTAGGKVYSFGNGSGVGKGKTEPRQLTPWLIEDLDSEIIIDIVTGDGHCLALTQRGEVYSWGTNSMGQCGQGHSNSSILRPSLVGGMEGVQAQQITVGTSHSIVWTAVPRNRQASALWHWPYCVDVKETTFKKLLAMLDKFGDFLSKGDIISPFTSKESQESVLLSLLSILCTHLSLVTPLGPSCVYKACGSSIKPLRDLLFRLVDSELPSALDQEASRALDAGALVLLPPVHERLDLLLSVLPEDPSAYMGLTNGQRLQLDVLLGGLKSQDDFVNVFAKAAYSLLDFHYTGVDMAHTNKVFELVHRMAQYIHKAAICAIHNEPIPKEVRLGSSLIDSFERFICSTYANIIFLLCCIADNLKHPHSDNCYWIAEQADPIIVQLLAPFNYILKDLSLSILKALTTTALKTSNPSLCLQKKQDVLFGFLAYQFPCHVALTAHEVLALDEQLCPTWDSLLGIAKATNHLITLLPVDVVLSMEKGELSWEQKGGSDSVELLAACEPVEHPWRQLLDYQRLLCYFSAKHIQEHYVHIPPAIAASKVLDYTPTDPSKGTAGKTNLLNSHIVLNGAIGSESAVTQALYTWATLCKLLPGKAGYEPQMVRHGQPSLKAWSSCLTDFSFLFSTSKPDYKTIYNSLGDSLDCLKPLDLDPGRFLYSLAVGDSKNETASVVYMNMLDYANHKDWNTGSDEDSVAELRQVSGAALACLLKHTGLVQAAMSASTKPSKKLVDVYRHVFSLRREVFTHRPIPDNEGKVAAADSERFRLQCNGICVTLLLFLCVLEPAILEEQSPNAKMNEARHESFSSDRMLHKESDGVRHSPAQRKKLDSFGPGLNLTNTLEMLMETSKAGTSTGISAGTSTGTSTVLSTHLELRRALSFSCWYQDRLEHLEAAGKEKPLHVAICTNIVDIVSQVFYIDQSDKTIGMKPQVQLLNRVDLIEILLSHLQRAESRKKCLLKIIEFITEDSKQLLLSSQLIFKSTCLGHKMHYMDGISVAPSVLQHQVKKLFYNLSSLVTESLVKYEPSQLDPPTDTTNKDISHNLSWIALRRELLLAVQWMTYSHQPADLSFFFSSSLFKKVAELSYASTFEVYLEPDCPSKLWTSVKDTCAILLQLLTLRVGLCAGVLKSSEDTMKAVARHMYTHLQSLVAQNDTEHASEVKLHKSTKYSRKKETELQEFLKFLGTLSATHSAIRYKLSDDQWCSSLLRIVDIDTKTGMPAVASLKTRLLTLQVLGSIMSAWEENTPQAQVKCLKIVEDLLELMYRCTFVMPMKSMSTALQVDEELSFNTMESESMFGTDIEHEGCIKYWPGGNTDKGMLVELDSAKPRYILSKIPLVSGKYNWKIVIEVMESAPEFMIGICEKQVDGCGGSEVPDINRLWGVSSSGNIITPSNHSSPTATSLVPLKSGMSLSLQYCANTNTRGCLLCDWGHGFQQVIRDIVHEDKPVYLIIHLLQADSPAPGHARIYAHPLVFAPSSSSATSFTKLLSHERLTSGYPHLSSVGPTLSHTIASLLLQLQDKEPWNRAMAQVIGSRLSSLGALIHKLKTIEKTSKPQDTSDHSVVHALSLLLSQLTQTMWPALAIVGGLEVGLCLGRACHVNGQQEVEGEVLVASVPLVPKMEVKVQKKVTGSTTEATSSSKVVPLSSLSMVSMPAFNLSPLLDHLSSSMLMSLADLAGYMDSFNISSLLQHAYSEANMATDVKDLSSSLPFQLTCHSVLQSAATRSLQVILTHDNVIQLLVNQPSPSLERPGDKPLTIAVLQILNAISARAILPSPLKPSLSGPELLKVESNLCWESFYSLGKSLSQSIFGPVVSQATIVSSDSMKEQDSGNGSQIRPPNGIQQGPSNGGRPDPDSSNATTFMSEVEGFVLLGEGENEELEEEDEVYQSMLVMAHGTTDSEEDRNIEQILIDMGFSHTDISLARRNCATDVEMTEQDRLDTLLCWILDNTAAFGTQELIVEAEAQEVAVDQQIMQQSDQTAATNKFISLVEESFHSKKGPESVKRDKADILHAPDLLEGPDVKDKVLGKGHESLLSSASYYKILLSALGIFQSNQKSPHKYEFAGRDPMGEQLYKINASAEGKETTSPSFAELYATGKYRISESCRGVIEQAVSLKSTSEVLAALSRVVSATQNLASRLILLTVLARLSSLENKEFLTVLKSLGMLDIQMYCNLLRLVHAGRLGGVPSTFLTIPSSTHQHSMKALDTLSNAIVAMITNEETSAAMDLMHCCSKDLFTAAVGGAHLGDQCGGSLGSTRDKSDLDIMYSPNFEVTKTLVQTLTKSASRLTWCWHGMLKVVDGLAACIYSSKLQKLQRLWVLDQLVKILAAYRSVNATVGSHHPHGVCVPASALKLSRSPQKLRSYMGTSRDGKLISLDAECSVLVWDLKESRRDSEMQVFQIPVKPSQALKWSFPRSHRKDYVAAAPDSTTLWVWSTRDGQCASHTFDAHICTLSFKPTNGAEVLTIGTEDGEFSLIEICKSSDPAFALKPSSEGFQLPHQGTLCCASWSPSGTKLSAGYTSGQVSLHYFTSSAFAVFNINSEVKSLCWSPGDEFLAVLGTNGRLELIDQSPNLAHAFEEYFVTCLQWHSEINKEDGALLLASGTEHGAVDLWIVRKKVGVHTPECHSSKCPSSIAEVSLHGSLLAHTSPVTCLAFSDTASLLASGCQDGLVLIWDIDGGSALRYTIREGWVTALDWTSNGLVVCHDNEQTLCILEPGPSDYEGERCLSLCLPLLHQNQGPASSPVSLKDTSKIQSSLDQSPQDQSSLDQSRQDPPSGSTGDSPCLVAFLKNLHYHIFRQHKYERDQIIAGFQLLHSEYLQLLVALAVGLDFHSVLLSPPTAPHLPKEGTPKKWKWLLDLSMGLSMAESLSKRVPFTQDCIEALPSSIKAVSSADKYQPTANNEWTREMDLAVLEWAEKAADDWSTFSKSRVYTWGNGTCGQLGHSMEENAAPTVVRIWKDVHQMVAGSYCTYAVKYDGSVASVGDGSYGKLGHGDSENESSLRVISALQGIRVVQVVAGPRMSLSCNDGFALALTDSGDVYSWGKGSKGRLGHNNAETIRSPKMIEALAAKNIKMIACCDTHCAAVSEDGRVFTFGSKDSGKLGHGRESIWGRVGQVAEIAEYYDVDGQTQLPRVKIGYVSCGFTVTLAISEDGSQVFMCGSADDCAFGQPDLTGNHHIPVLMAHLSDKGPYVMSVSGHRASSLLTKDGQVISFGKLADDLHPGVPANYIEFPNEAKVRDLSAANFYMLALTTSGDVYYWGKSQYGPDSGTMQRAPKIIPALSGKGLLQISAGGKHGVASDTTRPVKGWNNLKAPSSVPKQFFSLRDIQCEAIYMRLMLLRHFSDIISKSWALLPSIEKSKEPGNVATFHINPLCDEWTRSLLSTSSVEGMMAEVMSRTMTRKSHGPNVHVDRMAVNSDRSAKALFPQVARQVLQFPPSDIRCPTRAWKVFLLGEGADDAGGVFDDTIAEMCEELETGAVDLLIPAPNAVNKCGYNTDRFVINPELTIAWDNRHLKFLGVLMGVAMRTKKPLDLHLARPMWKLLAGLNLTPEDLEEMDLVFLRMLYGIRDAHKSGISMDDFSEMIPIDVFEARSMSGRIVPIAPEGHNMKLTFQNRKEYVERALHFRLHEMDSQIAVVREGMSTVIPVPFLSLYTAKMLENAVCGLEQVDLSVLKKVVRYKDNTSPEQDVVQWLWQTLESFTNEEKVLFLRFVSGRSRLPLRISDIPQRFQLSVYEQSDECLPTSQTCFFQLRLPNYSSKEVLIERLQYAIRNCRSIDMDNYMLRRWSSSMDTIDSDDEINF